VNSNVIALVISISVVILAAVIGLFYLRYMTNKNDQIWHVNVDELHFDDPPEVIGQGSFGDVLLAEYRGTPVAIKHATKTAHARNSRSSKEGSKGDSRGSASPQNSVGAGSLGTSDQTKTVHARNSKTNSSRSGAGSKEGSRGGSRGSATPQNSVGAGSLGTSDQTQQTDTELGINNPEYESKEIYPIFPGGSDEKNGGDQFSVGFLAADFGQNNKRAWLSPWMKKRSSISDKSMMARVCPCFSQATREEEEFIAEMRVLSRLRHPCITTVMGAVISYSHDPMLVMEYMEYGSLHDLLRNETMHLSG
jgi:serine/threonine protein kinase